MVGAGGGYEKVGGEVGWVDRLQCASMQAGHVVKARSQPPDLDSITHACRHVASHCSSTLIAVTTSRLQLSTRLFCRCIHCVTAICGMWIAIRMAFSEDVKCLMMLLSSHQIVTLPVSKQAGTGNGRIAFGIARLHVRTGFWFSLGCLSVGPRISLAGHLSKPAAIHVE